MKPIALVMDLALAILPPLEEKHKLLHLCDKDGTQLFCISYLDRETTRSTLRFLQFLDYFDDIIYPARKAEDFVKYNYMFLNPAFLWLAEPQEVSYKKVRPQLHQTHSRSIHTAMDFLTGGIA